MPRIKLNDRAVRALQPPPTGQADYFDTSASLPGFGLRVTAKGVKAWTLLYRHGGRPRRLTLGRYPVVSLADARTRAKEALAAIVQGDDPATEKRADREAPTFEEVAREYLERHAKPKKRSWREDERILDHDVLPAWRSRRAKDIGARDVRELLDGILDRNAPTQANRTFAIVRRVFNWASAPDRALVPQFHNPCRGIERPAPERQRDRVLNGDELRAIWAALDDEDVYNAALFRLYLLTAQRGGELRTMGWNDLDLSAGWWTIPAERSKNKLSHRVPLSPPAVEVLRQLDELRTSVSPWVFPTTRASASGYRERVYKAVERIRKASGVADFRPHDFRRSVASYMTSMGISRLTVSKLLNHMERGITAVYDRHSYDREKQEAVNAWATRLEQIVSGARARVLPFARA